jgi:hypothetical protein
MFGPGMYFKTGQVIFVPKWPKGEFVSILASFCVWTKSLMCKDAVNRDSTIQSDVRRFCLQVKRIQVPYQPSGRSSHPVLSPSVNQSSRPDDVRYCPDARQISIIRLAEVLIPSEPYTASRSFCASLHPSGRLSSQSRCPSVMDQLQFFPSSE